MAIDAGIYQQANNSTVPLESPLNALAKVTQLKQAQNQNKLFDMQVQDANEARSSKNALNSAYQSALDPTTGTIDRNKLYSGLASSGLGSQLPAVQKQFSEQDKASRDADKAKLEAVKQHVDLQGQILGSVKDQGSWTQALQVAQQNGMDVSKFPQQYDPNLVSQLRNSALSAKDQVDQQWKAKGYDLDVAKFGETVRNNKTQNGIAAGNLGVAQANLGLKRQELAQGKVPSGYRVAADGKSLEAIPGGPADAKASKESSQKTTEAKDVLGLLDEVDKILPNASGGAIGTAYNAAMGAFGKSTDGAEANAQLRALQGAIVSKMPKMSGPQSDADVRLYQQAAGDIANPNLPVKVRQSAVQTVRRVQEKYAGMRPGESNSPPVPSDIADLLKKHGK